MGEPVLKDKRLAGGGPALVTPTRYEDDLFTWVQEQVALLRAGAVDALDLDNIAEELSDVGNAQYSQLESALRVLLMHMLKWDQQPEKRTPSWIFSIREQRRRYARLLKKNPGLQSSLDEARDAAYPNARDWASDECHLPVDEFPPECPYEWDDILHRPFDFDSVKK
ncbi:DUF29 domain-containing protein [uncultured Methylobacterium sp.]|uniref:DUF29 domain-containing protein n=1 Tax=uncultured Methylobacterium sp. TaxID=157278 RepID=UPI0035CA5604